METEDLVKVAARAVYDCEMPDQDALAVLIHNYDFIDGGKPLPEQLADVLAVCTTIARAVIAAIAPRIRAEETEDIAAVGAILFDHLAGDRPELARAIIATLTPRIRAEEKERAAKVCEGRATYPKCPHTDWDDACLACAAAIREAAP